VKTSRRSLQTAAGLVSVAALIPLGLTACKAPPVPLHCSAVASSARPQQNTVDRIRVATVSGAAVVANAAFESSKVVVSTRSNAFGLARADFQVGAATVGFKVKVSVSVSKGGRSGSCVTSFTPVQAKPPALKAAISVKWLGAALGSLLPAPSGGACLSPHPGYGLACGTFRVDALISGFSAYRDIPVCPSGEDCSVVPGSSTLTGTASLKWSMKCSTNSQLNYGDANVHVPNIWEGRADAVTPLTRVSANSALLEIGADLQLEPTMAECSGQSTLESVAVTNVALHLQGTATPYPTSDFFAAGPFNKP
jgi:hypothetical protein